MADDLEELLDPDGGWIAPGIAADLDRIVSTIRNYIQPRLANRNAPFNVVFAGPTGSGKSTIINAIAGRTVSRSGSIRPTTTKPVVFSDRVGAASTDLGTVDADAVIGGAPYLRGLSLIDTPDIDSTNTDNHRTALGVLAAADVVVFVASALRYADLVPWDVLRSVTERGIPVIHVLNRMSPQNSGAVIDFRRRLRAALMTPRIVSISEHRLGDDRLLPSVAVQPVLDEMLTQVRHLSRAECLDRAFAALRSDLSAIVHSVNADMLRVDQVAAKMLPEKLSHDGYDPPAVVAGWESGLQRNLRSRLLGRQRAALDRVAGEVRSELVSLVERDVRMFAVEKGSLVIDLADGETPHLGRIDSVVADWFESIGSAVPSEELNAAGLRRRVESAISAFREVTEPALQPSEPALELLTGIAEFYTGLGEEILDGSNNQRVLAVVQRARARIRPESTLVSA